MIAIADADEKHLNQVGDALGTPREKRYRFYEEMLEKEKLDIVIVASQPDLHADLATRVIDAGIHVVVNKPMSVDLERAYAMVAAAERNGVRLAVLHQGRVSPREREVQRRIAAGDIGRIVEMRSFAKGYYGGYDLYNAAPHALNSMRGFVKAEFDSVQGLFESGGRPTQPEDIRQASGGFGLMAGQQLRCQVRFKDGAIGSLTYLHHEPAHSYNSFSIVVGTEGQFCQSYDNLYVSRDIRWGPNVEWEIIEFLPEQTRVKGVDADQPEGDIWFAHEMITVLNEGRDHTCSGKEALAGMEAITGCLVSHFLRDGARVSLPLKERRHPLLRAREEAGLGPAPEMPYDYYDWVEADVARLKAAGLHPYAIKGISDRDD